jgi:hypothetical protein
VRLLRRAGWAPLAVVLLHSIASRIFVIDPLRKEARLGHDRVVRGALWASVVLNLIGVALFLPPALGIAPELLPIPAPRFFAAQVALTIGLFGGVYAWLALRPRIDRPLLFVGALGKLGFFALAVAYWAAGDLPAAAVPQAMPDLALALVFLWWLWTTRRGVNS